MEQGPFARPGPSAEQKLQGDGELWADKAGESIWVEPQYWREGAMGGLDGAPRKTVVGARSLYSGNACAVVCD